MAKDCLIPELDPRQQRTVDTLWNLIANNDVNRFFASNDIYYYIRKTKDEN